MAWRRDASVGVARGDTVLHLLNQMSAGFALARGARGFFAARARDALATADRDDRGHQLLTTSAISS